MQQNNFSAHRTSAVFFSFQSPTGLYQVQVLCITLWYLVNSKWLQDSTTCSKISEVKQHWEWLVVGWGTRDLPHFTSFCVRRSPIQVLTIPNVAWLLWSGCQWCCQWATAENYIRVYNLLSAQDRKVHLFGILLHPGCSLQFISPGCSGTSENQ